MIEDLMKLKKQIDTMIETYKDLHRDDKEYIKTKALKRVREGYYESSFSKKQREEASESSKGSHSLCVYGDS